MSEEEIEKGFLTKGSRPYFLPLILSVIGLLFLIIYLITPISAHTMVFLYTPAILLAFIALIAILYTYYQYHGSENKAEVKA